jgi:hypothetical protein
MPIKIKDVKRYIGYYENGTIIVIKMDINMSLTLICNI